MDSAARAGGVPLNLPLLALALLALQLALVVARVVLVAQYLSGEHGRLLEWLGSLAVALLGWLWWCRDAGGWAYAAAAPALGMVQLALSLTATGVARRLDIGEDDLPLPLEYPLLLGLGAALVALPNTLGAAALIPYVLVLAYTAGLFALIAVVLPAAGIEAANPWILHPAALGLGVGCYLALETRGPVSALLLAAVLVGVSALLLGVALGIAAGRFALDLEPGASWSRAATYAGLGWLAAALAMGWRLAA